MTIRRSNSTSINNPCRQNALAIHFTLSLSDLSRLWYETSEWHRQVTNHLPSPELRMGLASDTAHDSMAWFLAVLHQPCAPSSAVTIHFGLIGIGPVLLPLFFLRSTYNREELLLETTLNPYQSDLQGLKLLRCLCTQDSYRIHCRDLATGTEHTLAVPNTHHALYRQAVNLLESHPPWTTTQFVQAQYHLAQSWPTPEARYLNLHCPPDHSSSLDV